MYGVTFENIPIINLRQEFRSTSKFVNSVDAEELLAEPGSVYESPLMSWSASPGEIATFLIQRAILGIESYLPYAFRACSIREGVFCEALNEKLKNVFLFRGKGLVSNLYHRAPFAIREEMSLYNFDHSLYQRTVHLYSDIRNPVFHGKRISNPDIKSLRLLYEHFEELYSWIDYWHNHDAFVEMLATKRERKLPL